MKSWQRLPSPDFLVAIWEKHGQDYAAKRATDSGFQFKWPKCEHNGVKLPLNQLLLPTLIQQTQEHCSYCDSWPPRIGDNTIDHFRPKSDSRFYGEVCQWENLYYACNDCQKAKGTQYDPLLIRPDETDYSFERYFLYNFRTHEIEINPLATESDQARADTTIRILNLNEIGLTKKRKMDFHLKDKFAIDELPFRFMFEI